MRLYCITFLDRSDQVIEDRVLRARDVGHAMAKANRRLCSSFRVEGPSRLDPRGRVDVRDPQGAMLARIYCAETIAAMS